MKDCCWLSKDYGKTVKDNGRQSEDKDWLSMILWRLWKIKDWSSEYKESISVYKIETFYTKIEREIDRLITFSSES